MSSSNDFPGFDHLYWLCDAHSTTAYRGSPDTEQPSLLLRGELHPRHAVAIEHLMGGKPKDFIWTGSVQIVCVNDRVISLLETNDFTGWGTYSVQIVGKDGGPIPGYHGLSVTGRCGPLQDERSGRFMKEFPARTRERRLGVFFDESTWDGSDFFMSSDGKAYKFVHQRVKDCLEKAKVTNVRFERLDQIEWG